MKDKGNLINQLNKHIIQERLNKLIESYGKRALENRQIARRLHNLLPERFKSLRLEYFKRKPASSETAPCSAPAGKAERGALADPRYVNMVDEFVEINYQATLAKIQFETHIMLNDARSTLRKMPRP